MAFIIADRVQETTATTGVGTLNLAGAVSGFQSFVAGVGTGNQCAYCLLSGDGVGWETGIGTVTAGTPNTLARSPITSSNANAAISLTATSTVFLTETAAAFMGGMGGPIVPPPKMAAWTQRNFVGTTSLADVANGVLLKETLFQNSDTLRIASMAAPSTPYTIDAIFSFFSQSNGTATLEFGWTDGTKYQIHSFGLAASVKTVYAVTWSTVTTAVANLALSKLAFVENSIYARISDDGTNAAMAISLDGVSFVTHYTSTKAAGYLGSAGYTNVCWGLDNNTGGGTSSPPACMVTLKSWWVH